MNPRMKLWVVSALFLLLALPNAALAQRADDRPGRGNVGRGHDDDRGRGNSGRGDDDNRGRNDGHYGRPVVTHPTRPPHGSVAPVPEPTAALVFAGGLLAARYGVRRRS